MAFKHRRCSISLVIQKMEIKITMKYHFTQILMALMGQKKSQEIRSVGKDAEPAS
jgi:hypothetical protein